MEAEQLIIQNNYEILKMNASIEFRKKKTGLPVLWIAIIGIVVLLFGLAVSSIFIFLFGIALIIWFVVQRRQSNPRSFTIDLSNYRIYISNSILNSYEFHLSSISSLQVDEKVLTSDVSPFKEGYQDFHYQFSIVVGERNIRLMGLELRKQNDKDVKLVFDYLSDLLSISEKSS